MNRGSSGGRRHLARRRQGFNEAPIHESGKSEGRLRVSSRLARRFNEAPIHESGKCPSWAALPDSPSRFNEAPIHESGK